MGFDFVVVAVLALYIVWIHLRANKYDMAFFIELDECIYKPCVHGSCKDVVDGHVCTCETGYAGVNCDEGMSGQRLGTTILEHTLFCIVPKTIKLDKLFWSFFIVILIV